MFAAGSGSKNSIEWYNYVSDICLWFLEAASSLCCQLLNRVCLEPETCGPLMCGDDLFDVLCRPIRQFLSTKKSFNDYLRSNQNVLAEDSLINLANLFAAMASNDIGYQFLTRTPATPNSYDIDMKSIDFS